MGVWRKKGLVPVVLSTEESISVYSFETEACADWLLCLVFVMI